MVRPKPLALLCCLLGAALLAQTPTTRAADFPTRPIRVVVPFPPGGNTDVLARLMGQKITANWNQNVVVDNRPGAAGLLGADLVAKGNADGHTVLMTALGGITLDNLKLFTPLMLVASAPSVLVVHPSVKATSAKELIAFARANPGALRFGSSGIGSQSHLGPELLKSMTKIDVTHVPYKGAGQSIADLLGGHIQFMMTPYAALSAHIKAGRLRPLAVTSLKRSSSTPELPTLAEAGVPGYEASGWFGALVPSGVPRSAVAALSKEFNRVIVLPDVSERLTGLGMELGGGTPEQFAAFIREDTEKWAKIIKEAGIVMK